MKHIRLISALLLLSVLGSFVHAQTPQPWDENHLQWTNPTTCTTGEPIAQCPITAIRIEEAPTVTGTWRPLVTLPVVGSTYTHGGASAGQHCYRVFVDSSKGASVASNVSCKTNTKPVGPPNPATGLVVVEPIAYNVKPDFGRFVFVRGSQAGTARLGAACDPTRTTADGYSAIVSTRTTVRVAKCGAG